jgi:Fe-S-cluster containining protein
MMHDPLTPLAKNQTFCFSCSPEVACFNACCRDLNQVLTPYDVLCLKRFLNMSSGDFLDAYTNVSTGPGTGLPVVSLRFEDAADLACPFVSDAGCRVYPARPASCRTYPLARGVSRHRGTGDLTEHWALIREPHCRGFRNGRPQTVAEWIDDQQIAEHNRMNDMMLELISLKNRFRPGPLMPAEKNHVYTAKYDLDRFRDDWLKKEGHMATAAGVRPPDRDQIEDKDLLVAAMDWIRDRLFNPNPEKPQP